MNTLAILQARMSSNRLPGKVMSLINGEPMIFWEIQRIRQAKNVNQLIVATSTDSTDDYLANFLENQGIQVHRGPLNDVHARFVEVLTENSTYESIVRLTADCPLVMPDLIDSMLDEFETQEIDYYSNCRPPTFPDGLDVEIFSREAFMRLSDFELSDSEREHVTLAFGNKDFNFRLKNRFNAIDYSWMRWTVDYEPDLIFVQNVYTKFQSKETHFNFHDVLGLVTHDPDNFPMLPGEFRNDSLRAKEQP